MQNNNQEQQNFQHSNKMSPEQSHGGNELYSARETITAIIGTLDQYTLLEPHIKDQELKTILQHQHAYISQTYNTIVDTFSTGQKPATSTKVYQMEQSNNVLYGLQPSAPKSPCTSAQNIDDAHISGFMLGQLKSCASALTMSALEATNPILRRIFADSVPNTLEMAYELFLYQNKHHYYQVSQLKQEDATTIINGFSKIQNPQAH